MKKISQQLYFEDSYKILINMKNNNLIIYKHQQFCLQSIKLLY